MGKLEEWGVYTDRFNPLRKLYIYPDERAAAEDMAFVFFTVREFPMAWRFFVTTAAFAGGVNWEHGYPLDPPLVWAVPAAGLKAGLLDRNTSTGGRDMKVIDEYGQVIEKTVAMVRDREAMALAQQHGLQILNVTWEDTARYDMSAVGPNISDMTIQVQHKPPGRDTYELSCMPVIRYPNFSDVTGDISPDLFCLLVGNERGGSLTKITLRELLGNLRAYLHSPNSWRGNHASLLADHRDSHVLVSAQACFLPISKEGTAEFNPVVFNYQSFAGDPAVLAILATREGTSVTVIDNQRDAFEAGGMWGQRLFFNQNGERASLTGQRKSDFLAEAAMPQGAPDASEAPTDREGLNMVLLIQVPLKQKEPMRFRGGATGYVGGDLGIRFCLAPAASDVEEAVIGHGEVEGPFTEIDGLEIERDDRYPIRVTVQFYKATSNGVVSGPDMADIAGQINRVYQQADYVGSLVVDGPTGRPTEYCGSHGEPPDWWQVFWERHYQHTGRPREEAVELLRRLLGDDWTEKSLEDAEAAVGSGSQGDH